MDVLIVGFGSIGQRHARILFAQGHNINVVSQKTQVPYTHFKTIDEALKAQSISYVVIANVSSAHSDTLLQLNELGFVGKVLIEKPLYIEKVNIPRSILNFEKITVGFNLRFHPCVQKLKELVSNSKAISAQIYVGQYLPTWRPQTDYRNCYSANRSEGGGVLRDLCHELDYINWVFGTWKRVAAIGGKFSKLDIDSDDSFTVLIETERCPMITLELNYLDRIKHRYAIVNTESSTIEMNLLESNVMVGDGESIKNYSNDISSDFSYEAEHQEILKGNNQYSCSYEEGLNVVDMVLAIEQSAKSGKWVAR